MLTIELRARPSLCGIAIDGGYAPAPPLRDELVLLLALCLVLCAAIFAITLASQTILETLTGDLRLRNADPTSSLYAKTAVRNLQRFICALFAVSIMIAIYRRTRQQPDPLEVTLAQTAK